MNRFGGELGEKAEVGPDQETGDDISQDQRLFERLGDDGEDTGSDQDDGQFGYETQFFGHCFRIGVRRKVNNFLAF